MNSRCPRQNGFSLIELLVCLVIVAVLVGVLLPLLSQARVIASQSLCATNLRQMGIAWQAYMQEHDQLPRHTAEPEWNYGGARFINDGSLALMDDARPINPYLAQEGEEGSTTALRIFRDASDSGIHMRGDPASGSLLGGTCYETFGTSYRANPLLMDSTRAGIDALHRPLSVAEITAQPSRLLLVADPAWYLAVQPPDAPEAGLEASWHGVTDGGNMAAFDGSVRWVVFGPLPHAEFEMLPRPELGAGRRPR